MKGSVPARIAAAGWALFGVQRDWVTRDNDHFHIITFVFNGGSASTWPVPVPEGSFNVFRRFNDTYVAEWVIVTDKPSVIKRTHFWEQRLRLFASITQ